MRRGGVLDPVRDRDLIAANKTAVMESMPEILPFIKELHAAGAIEGWRNIVEVGPPIEVPEAPREPAPREDESMQAVIRRMVENGTYKPIRGR